MDVAGAVSGELGRKNDAVTRGHNEEVLAIASATISASVVRFFFIIIAVVQGYGGQHWEGLLQAVGTCGRHDVQLGIPYRLHQQA